MVAHHHSCMKEMTAFSVYIPSTLRHSSFRFLKPSFHLDSHNMFCSTLRSRPLWKEIGLALASNPYWQLRGRELVPGNCGLTIAESRLENHDLSIPVPNSSSSLRVLLMTQRELDRELQTARARASRSLRPCSDLIILLLDGHDELDSVHDGLAAYLRLQAMSVSLKPMPRS